MPSPQQALVVTIDTEVDKDCRWRISDPPSFRSVTHGVPERLSPLFDRYGAVPTYLLSAEVIEDARSVAVLSELGSRAELGTHLHAEFVAPERTLTPTNMAGATASAVQCALGAGVEAAKLGALTDLFTRTFGWHPTAFRAGRYGIGGDTLESLASLGYVVDSSVTPGLRWRYPDATIDFRRFAADPQWISASAGRILELPISIRPGSGAARAIRWAPDAVARVARRALGRRAQELWLRPTWETGEGLVRYIEAAPERVLVLMLHSMEIVPGASPYARSQGDCDRIIASLDHVLAYCVRRGIALCGLTEASTLV